MTEIAPARPMRRFTEAHLRLAEQMLAEGLTYVEMGKRLGFCADTVARHLDPDRRSRRAAYDRQRYQALSHCPVNGPTFRKGKLQECRLYMLRKALREDASVTS